MTNVITHPCPICGQTSIVKVDYQALKRWQRGELIQNCFPEMSAPEREQLKTGYHPECWRKVFAPSLGQEDNDV